MAQLDDELLLELAVASLDNEADVAMATALRHCLLLCLPKASRAT